MNFVVVYHSQVRKDLRDIPAEYRRRIQKAIEEKIAIDPTGYGQFLSGSLKPCFKFRVGPYRIIYDVRDREIVILIIAHRSIVYDKGLRRHG